MNDRINGYCIHYSRIGGMTSFQICWDDVLTHIKLRRLAGLSLPAYVTKASCRLS